MVTLKTEIPGPRSRELLRQVAEQTPQSVSHSTPIAVAGAKGALVTDLDGNTYIDFTGGIGVLNVGHCSDAVVAAIEEQAREYIHTCFMVVAYEPYVLLAKKLNEITPGSFPKKTMFCNSGAEAVENALKAARAYTKRPGIISFEGGFHGRTLLALSVTGKQHPYKEGFGPFAPDVYHIPFPNPYRCDQCRESPCAWHSPEYLHEFFRVYAPANEIAAVIVEPVQGEGGFVVPPKEYFAGLKRICEGNGILFIADEIQTGFGRTGRMFAMEHFGVEPDIVTTGKSLGGGMPLSAVTGRAEVMDAPQVGGLGGTYGGNPIACRAGLATIEMIERNGLLHRAEHIGRRVLSRFQDMKNEYPLIGDVRGLGAMVGMELVEDRSTKNPATAESLQVAKRCWEQGLLIVLAAGNVIRTLMPLVITDEELEEGLGILERSIAEVNGRRA